MANPNRTAIVNKAHRVLKQHYKPVEPPERPLLEQLLFACCLENATYEQAEKVYNHLAASFFDWNEVRVSTVTELSEAMHGLPDPVAAATNLKRILQGVFEATYSFDLELLKKQNIGAAIKQLEQHGGATPFVIAYITQTALEGHAIPVDQGALDLLVAMGAVTEAEAEQNKPLGLERAIPKNKGVEFGSLLHQFAAEFVASPGSTNVKKVLLAINPDAKVPPKRTTKKAAPVTDKKKSVEKAVPQKTPAEKAAAEKSAKAATKKSPADGKPEKPSEKATAEKGHAEKPHGEKPHSDKAHSEKANSEKSSGQKPAAKAKGPDKAADGKKPAHGAKPQPSAGKSHSVSAKRKVPAKQLTKRKPR